MTSHDTNILEFAKNNLGNPFELAAQDDTLEVF